MSHRHHRTIRPFTPLTEVDLLRELKKLIHQNTNKQAKLGAIALYLRHLNQQKTPKPEPTPPPKEPAWDLAKLYENSPRGKGYRRGDYTLGPNQEIIPRIKPPGEKDDPLSQHARILMKLADNPDYLRYRCTLGDQAKAAHPEYHEYLRKVGSPYAPRPEQLQPDVPGQQPGNSGPTLSPPLPVTLNLPMVGPSAPGSPLEPGPKEGTPILPPDRTKPGWGFPNPDAVRISKERYARQQQEQRERMLITTPIPPEAPETEAPTPAQPPTEPTEPQQPPEPPPPPKGSQPVWLPDDHPISIMQRERYLRSQLGPPVGWSVPLVA